MELSIERLKSTRPLTAGRPRKLTPSLSELADQDRAGITLKETETDFTVGQSARTPYCVKK